MPSRIFGPDSGLYKTLDHLTDTFFLSLLWLACSLPLVTLPAATAALYDAVFRRFRREEPHVYQRFFQVLRRELKSGVLLGLVLLAGTAAVLAIRVGLDALALATDWGKYLYFAWRFLEVPLLGVGVYAMVILSRFETSFGALLVNTLKLSVARLPVTVALGLLGAVFLRLCLRYLFPAVFLPVVILLLASFPVEHSFRPFLNGEDE